MTLEEENEQLRTELIWIHTLMRNDHMQSDEKVVLYEARYELLHSECDENGVARIFVWKIADETGLSRDKAGKSLRLLSDHGVLERKVDHVPSERGQFEKAIYIRLTDVARNPSEIVLPASRKGGKRTKRCTSCGHDVHIQHTRCICTACGSIFEEDWKTIEPNTIGENDHEEES